MKLRKLLSGGLALALTLGLSAPAFAEGLTAPAQQLPSPWSYSALADAYAMGLVDDNYTAYILDPVTDEQMTSLTTIVADKLALLELPENELAATELVIDNTRGGVMNALYQEAAAYSLPGIEADPAFYLTQLGVVTGDQNGDLHTGRVCTFQEAMVMAQRLILALYDLNGAGSRGMLWKAVNGDNTLYLLGTIHMDRGNVYPFHKSLRDAIAAAQEVIFEVDFNDAEGNAAFAAMQLYSDGTTLKDHIPPELYADVVEVFTQLGMTEEQVAAYKPWPLMLTLNNLMAQDDSTSANVMAVDSYINAAAVNAGKTIGAVETYALQGAIFDDLSAEYQEEGLSAYVDLFLATAEGESDENSEELQAADNLAAQYDAMMNAWKDRDLEAFEAIYDKEAIVNSDDELNAKLFTQRDPHMIEAAAEYLETEGENTFFMAVGLGHMIDPGGIVSGLRELGYTVELME